MMTLKEWAEYFPGMTEEELKKLKSVSDFWELTEKPKMSFVERIKYNAKNLWDDHKEAIIAGGILGVIWFTCAACVVHGFKDQKRFNKEIQAKYGPNTTHGNIFSGSMSKRRANLEAWEKGNKRSEFEKVMAFAKTLNLTGDDSYTIEGFNNPDKDHIAISVFQQSGPWFHSDWITK